MPSYHSSTTILPWPHTVRPNSVTLYPQANVSAFVSPFTRTVQTAELPGALFQLQATFPPLKEAAAGEARALIARLRGRAGRFYFPVSRCSFAVPEAYRGERVIRIALTADQTGVTADRTDITIDATQIQLESLFVPDDAGSSAATRLPGTLYIHSHQRPLKVGQYVSWDDADGWRHLHLVVGLEWVNRATGQIVLTLEPPMRARPTSGTPVHITYPSGVFMFTADDIGQLTMGAGRLHTGLTLSAQQAFPLSITV